MQTCDITPEAKLFELLLKISIQPNQMHCICVCICVKKSEASETKVLNNTAGVNFASRQCWKPKVRIVHT